MSSPVTAIAASSATRVPGLSTTCSPTRTAPAMTRRRARSRLPTAPRSTNSLSSRSRFTDSRLAGAGDDPTGEVAQRLGAIVELAQRVERLLEQLARPLLRRRQAEHRRKRRLVQLGVSSLRLAGDRGWRLCVQNVVGDLE